ncbi:hypothetical protein [Actinokineospora globicatena]|uniref:hypothetical protein n=1 Tax=Actinokineospora globicatena TaxID=103729 RepID=UPI0020A2501F|nr:hypothetical protein [Actinokineospora globicatena]MCP2304907.1 hypothetical protein [Actinokineospora globicatena]GLW77712.1 hypothetical protein Aglo01_21940 [Actinokineospora globicatena]GLW85619.1 hypothetical protein Aglo02_32590 [Actinokineospora globicatena]
MSAFGELFGSQKLRKESQDDAGNGQDPALERVEDLTTGPIDLDAGVLYVRRPTPPKPADSV